MFQRIIRIHYVFIPHSLSRNNLKNICIQTTQLLQGFILYLLMSDTLFNEYVLKTYLVPGTVVGTGDIRMNQKDLCLWTAQSLMT